MCNFSWVKASENVLEGKGLTEVREDFGLSSLHSLQWNYYRNPSTSHSFCHCVKPSLLCMGDSLRELM